MTRKAAFVTLLGAPNAGKSTLLNSLVGAKVSIVSSKVQTTRFKLRGIRVLDETQLVFVDTPGIFAPKHRLDKAMVQAAWSGVEDADVILFLVDAAGGMTEEVKAIAEGLGKATKPVALVLNKIDKVQKDSLLILAQKMSESGSFDRIFMVSALKKDGVEDIERYLTEKAPAGAWLYPEDQLTDVNERLLASEITRETLFNRLHQELPYALTVETESWEPAKSGGIKIGQVIYVEREAHKKIIIGKGGQSLKAISEHARRQIARLLGEEVHLFLFVKVREKWKDNPEHYRAMGLEF